MWSELNGVENGLNDMEERVAAMEEDNAMWI